MKGAAAWKNCERTPLRSIDYGKGMTIRKGKGEKGKTSTGWDVNSIHLVIPHWCRGLAGWAVP